jgi:hypothetical protein
MSLLYTRLVINKTKQRSDMLYSEREVKMIQALEQLKNKKITIGKASIILNCSKRTVFRLQKRYLQGPENLIHKNKGRPSHRATNPAWLTKIEELMNGDFKGFGPTFVQNKLAQNPYNICLSRETIRKFYKKKGFSINTRKRSPYRSKRPRKCQFGDMWQLDGSYHDWFSGRAPWCSLIAIVDDATSALIGLQFHNHESTVAVMKTLKPAFVNIGIPHQLYTDKHSIYRIANHDARERGELSELEKACQKIGLKIIHAHSPQAKGRVERKFRVLQDWLVKELSLRGISSMDEANAFLEEFLLSHNKAFAKNPLIPGSSHRSAEPFNLDEILTINETRVLKKDWTLQYQTTSYQLHKEQPTRLTPGDKITVRTYWDGTIKFFKKNHLLSATLIIDRPVLVPNHMTPKPRTPFFLPTDPPRGYRYDRKYDGQK